MKKQSVLKDVSILNDDVDDEMQSIFAEHMKMGFRWYGEGNDPIPLAHIKQIPGVTGLVWALHDVPVGEVWSTERIEEVKRQAEAYGFDIDVVESVNVHEDIKLGKPSRDLYIENYKQTIRNLASVGVKVICYNFMPVFDWTRTDLYHPLPDGSNALFFEKAMTIDVDVKEVFDRITEGAKGMTMPGFEPEKRAIIEQLFEEYQGMTEEKMFANAKYFLDAIIPICEECDIKMGIHPDDPPWDIFGLPRLIKSAENIQKYLNLNPSPNNGLTFCSGSLGAGRHNDPAEIIRRFGDRIHFAHIRNVKHFTNGDFIESSHRNCDGDVDITDVVRALHDIGFTGYARPDHGRHIWGEEAVCRPGYGLYDRALGVMYLWGAWDTLVQNEARR